MIGTFRSLKKKYVSSFKWIPVRDGLCHDSRYFKNKIRHQHCMYMWSTILIFFLSFSNFYTTHSNYILYNVKYDIWLMYLYMVFDFNHVLSLPLSSILKPRYTHFSYNVIWCTTHTHIYNLAMTNRQWIMLRVNLSSHLHPQIHVKFSILSQNYNH